MRSLPAVCVPVLILGSILPPALHAQFAPPSKQELEMTSDPKAPGAPAVVLYHEEKDDDPHHFRTVYTRIKILTEAGKDAATVHITYQKHLVFNAAGTNSSRMASGTANHWDAPDINHSGEDRPFDTGSYAGRIEVAAIEGRTIHPDGTITPLAGAPADLLKESHAGSATHEMTFNMPAVEVGSILEYRYQVRYDRFLGAPEWIVQQPWFVHRAHYLFIPAEQFSPERTRGGAGLSNSAILGANGEIMTDIRVTAVLPPGKSVKQDALNQWQLDLTDIPAIPNELHAPPLASQVYRVAFNYIYTPDQKEFWQKEMSAWTRDVNQYTAPTPLLHQAVAESCSPSDTPLDKARKLYALVQKIDNTDIGRTSTTGLIPRGSVELVLQDKKGTGKEITFLYLALARAAGLPARPERISTRERGLFDPNFLNTDQLDAVVIALTLDDKEIVLDPGVKTAPFQTLYWSHAGAAGIAMTNGKVESVITPLQDNKDNTTVRVGTLTVTPTGAVSGALKVGFTGQQAIRLRQRALLSGPEALKAELNQMIAAEVPAGFSAQVERVANLDDPAKQLVAIVPVSGTLAATAGRLILPRLFFETGETNPFPAEEHRSLPIDLLYPAQDQEQITYILPAGFALESKPDDTVFKWEENAAYQLRSKADSNSVTTARIIARGFTMLDAKEYTPPRDFYQKVIAADQQQLVVSPSQPGKGQ
ncbi:DUF3857 domain-containing protein [Acidobacteria bacterium AB60]|nr:DUF3857 domain-containing protein [Acidobacteria bacterium AB60]